MKYRIKTWEELINTPDVRFNGGILCHRRGLNGFVPLMGEHSNEIIDGVIDNNGVLVRAISDHNHWTYNDWMLTPVKQHNFKTLYEKLL